MSETTTLAKVLRSRWYREMRQELADEYRGASHAAVDWPSYLVQRFTEHQSIMCRDRTPRPLSPASSF